LVYPSYLTLTDEGKTADKTETVLCQDSEAEILQKLGLQQKPKDGTLSEVLNVIGTALFTYAVKKGFLDDMLSSSEKSSNTNEEENDDEDLYAAIGSMEKLLDIETHSPNESILAYGYYMRFQAILDGGYIEKDTELYEKVSALIARYIERVPQTD
jgi:hypothetical protein